MPHSMRVWAQHRGCVLLLHVHITGQTILGGCSGLCFQQPRAGGVWLWRHHLQAQRATLDKLVQHSHGRCLTAMLNKVADRMRTASAMASSSGAHTWGFPKAMAT